jgi:hypothetical protein
MIKIDIIYLKHEQGVIIELNLKILFVCLIDKAIQPDESTKMTQYEKNQCIKTDTFKKETRDNTRDHCNSSSPIDWITFSEQCDSMVCSSYKEQIKEKFKINSKNYLKIDVKPNESKLLIQNAGNCTFKLETAYSVR